MTVVTRFAPSPTGRLHVGNIRAALHNALFAFAKYEHGDILAEGRKELTAIAEQLKAAENASITVAGHTDRIGSDSDNQLLSQRRARTVR